MKPYLVAQTLDSIQRGGHDYAEGGFARLVSQTAGTPSSLMQQAVSDGTGSSAQVAGVVAGKTVRPRPDRRRPGDVVRRLRGTYLFKPSIALRRPRRREQTAATGTGGSAAGPMAASIIDAAVDQNPSSG